MNRVLGFIFGVILIIDRGYTFTLVSNPETKFASSKVTIDVSSNNCQNLPYTTAELLDFAMEAATKFWNSVPTSSLELEKGEERNLDLSTGTLEDAISGARANTIIIACSDGSGYGTGSDNPFEEVGVIGVGTISATSSGVKGSVLINDYSTTVADTLSRERFVALIAHEMGHALGLYHSSDSGALMFYQLGRHVKRLSEDDRDGITYLYPRKAKVPLVAACGSLQERERSLSFMLSLLIGCLLLLLPIFSIKKRVAV